MPYPATTIGLLVASNVFMTFAWYGHLKFKSTALVTVIVISWGIALFEYCLMVPANRLGHAAFSAAELKTIQEIITLAVFAIFSVLSLKEPLSWSHVHGFGCIALGAFFHLPQMDVMAATLDFPRPRRYPGPWTFQSRNS